MLMSQSLSTYALVQCVVSAAEFASGEIRFYDTYAELTATDGDGNSTSPLRVEYDVLQHFRIVRAQGVMRLTLPRTVVRRWAAQNAFETQLSEFEEDPTSVHDGSGAKLGAMTSSLTAVLALQLTVEDMAAFLQSIAPLIAASRRTRSASRISVTEPLPVFGVPLEDPAGSVRTGSPPLSSAISSASVSSQETGTARVRKNHGHATVLVSDRCHRRKGGGEKSTAHRGLTPIVKDTEQERGSASSRESNARRTAADFSDSARPAAHRASELLGGRCDDSVLEMAEAEADCIAAPSLSSSSTASVSAERDNGGGATPRSCRVAQELPISVVTNTAAVGHLDRMLLLPSHQSSQQATPPQVMDTLESVTEQLVELMEGTEEPGGYRGGRREPLHRRRPTAVSTSTVLRGARQHRASRGSYRHPLPSTTPPAASSACPSLTSTISEVPAMRHPHFRQSPSGLAAKAQCEQGILHPPALADSDPGVVDRPSARRPTEEEAVVKRRCTTRAVRNRGGAHLCASEFSSTSTSKLSRPAECGERDGDAVAEKCISLHSPISVKRYRDVNEATIAAGVAVCDPSGVRCGAGDVAGSEAHSTALHAGGDTGSSMCEVGNRIAPATKSLRVSSTSSSAATSVKLGDMLVAPSAAGKIAGASTETMALPKRTVQFYSDSAVAAPLTAATPYPRQGGMASVETYLRELFPVEDIVPASTVRRRKRRSSTAASAMREQVTSKRHGCAPPRRGVKSAALTTGVVATAVGFPCGPRKSESGLAVSQFPDETAVSSLLSPPVRVKRRVGTTASKRAPSHRCTPSAIVEAVGAAGKRTRTEDSVALHFSHTDLDAACGRENITGAIAASDAAGGGSAAPFTKRDQFKAGSVVSALQRLEVSVSDARSLGLVQVPVSPHVALLATSPAVVGTALAASRKDEAAAYSAKDGGGAATAALSGDAARVDADSLISVSGARADSCEGSQGAAHRTLSHLLQDQCVTHEAASPCGCVNASVKHSLARRGAGQSDEEGDRASVGSSQATCPLLYCRNSRKERGRRALRYMNIISHNIAAVHEAHDALRGVLLLMMDEGQL